MNEVIGYVDTRAAEVATTAIASDVAQVHQDMLDADADASAAAASAAAAAGTLANAVKKTGEASQSIAGDIAVSGDLSGGTVTVPTPVNNTDAANKKYVDDQDALDVHLTGAQNVAGVKTFSDSPIVPTEATGTFSTKAATSNKVKNELDNYAPMVRTTGNQTITGGTKLVTGQSQFLEHGKLIRGSNATQNVEYVLATSANASGDARFVIEVITLSGYGIVNVNQNSGVVTKQNILGTALSAIDFDIDVVDNIRILYFKKLIGADMIVNILNFNVNGVWNGCNIETGYVPR